MKKNVLLIVLSLVMFSTMGIAQEKEYQVADDGFEWYKIKRSVNGEMKYGAEDRYGNMIVPTEYSDMWFRNDNNPILTGFGPKKGKYRAWYNKSGKCIVPFSRGYTWVQKWDQDEFGTYYTFEKPDGGGILDRNGREVASVKVDGLNFINIYSRKSNGKTYYYLSFKIQKGGEEYEGIADANGRIVVAPEYKDYSTARDLAMSRLTTTTNPLAGNRHETLAEAQAGPSSGSGSYSSSSSSLSSSSSSSSNSGNNSATIHVEHHRDPVPVQVWKQCIICGGSGKCQTCGGTGIFKGWSGNSTICEYGCGGSGKCSFCAGHGGHYEVEYR